MPCITLLLQGGKHVQAGLLMLGMW